MLKKGRLVEAAPGTKMKEECCHPLKNNIGLFTENFTQLF